MKGYGLEFLQCVNYDLGDMTLSQGHGTRLVMWNIIQIQNHEHDSKEFIAQTDFGYLCTVTLSLGQGHGQQLCQMSWSSLTNES